MTFVLEFQTFILTLKAIQSFMKTLTPYRQNLSKPNFFFKPPHYYFGWIKDQISMKIWTLDSAEKDFASISCTFCLRCHSIDHLAEISKMLQCKWWETSFWSLLKQLAYLLLQSFLQEFKFMTFQGSQYTQDIEDNYNRCL